MEKSLNVMKCVLVKETELKYTTKSSPCDTINNYYSLREHDDACFE